MKPSAAKEGKAAPRALPAVFPSFQHLEPGRVVLAVPDGWNGGMVVDYFRSQVWEGDSVNEGMVVDYFRQPGVGGKCERSHGGPLSPQPGRELTL